jgi:hypothetical protein
MTAQEDRRQATRREADEPVRDWRSLIIAALWMVLFAVVGWIGSTTNAEMNRMREQINTNMTRQAVFENEQKNTREMLIEIRTLVYELRQQQQQMQQIQQDRKR